MTSTAKCARRQNTDPGGKSRPRLSGRGNKQFLSSLLNFWRSSDRSLTKRRNMQLGGLPVPKKRDNDSKKRRGGICFIQIRLAKTKRRNGLLALLLTVVVRVAWPKAVSSKICVPFFRGLSRKPIKSPFLEVRPHVKRAYNCPTAQPIHCKARKEQHTLSLYCNIPII